MAMVKSSFSPTTQITYNKTGVYSDRFYTGLGQQNTTALGPYHCYTALAWFNSSAIASAISGERIVRVSITATSIGDSQETSDPCSVRVYRTAIGYDASKDGKNSIGSKNPAQGLTYSSPTDQYWKEYSETANIVKGQTIQDCILFTGQSASAFALALSQGYAMGAFVIPNATTWTGNNGTYKVRKLKDLSVSIYHEPQNTQVTAPSSVLILDNYAGAGSEIVRVKVSGATQPESGANNITGYGISYRKSVDGGTTWGSWSSTADFYSAFGKTDAVLVYKIINSRVSAGNVLQLRVRTVSELNTSSYVNSTGTITITDAPARPVIVSKSSNYTRGKVVVDIPASSYPTSLFLYADDECVAQTNNDGGRAVIYRDFADVQDGNYTLLTIKDDYGGTSPQTYAFFDMTDDRVSQNWIQFKGVRSECYGLLVADFMLPNSAQKDVQNVQIIGMSGDVQMYKDNTYKARDMRVVMYAQSGSDLDDIKAYLSGSGELIVGDHPNDVYDVSVQSVIQFSRVSRGVSDHLIAVTFHAQPFHRHADDKYIALSRSGLKTHNNGITDAMPIIKMYGNGDLTISVADKALTVLDVSTSCIVDCKTHKVKDADGQILETSGEFPTLPVGMSTVQFSQNVTNVEMQRNILYM